MSVVRQDPVLARFKAAVLDAFGGRVTRVLLFGSRARGDARADSDYDVAVFMDLPADLLNDRLRLADIGFDVMLETGQIVNTMLLATSEWSDRTPLMHEIRADGVQI